MIQVRVICEVWRLRTGEHTDYTPDFTVTQVMTLPFPWGSREKGKHPLISLSLTSLPTIPILPYISASYHLYLLPHLGFPSSLFTLQSLSTSILISLHLHIKASFLFSLI